MIKYNTCSSIDVVEKRARRSATLVHILYVILHVERVWHHKQTHAATQEGHKVDEDTHS